MDITHIMNNFLQPQSVALIGCTRKTGEYSMNILEHLLAYAYSGKLYPVNPNAGEILGIKSYPSIGAVPGQVDLAVISTPRELVPSQLEQCAARGITSAIIVGQGFKDSGDSAGSGLHKQISETVRTRGIRVIGPNTFGTANGFINFCSAFVRFTLAPNPVGIICQSGTFFNGFPEFTLLGKCLDLGNNCDIDFEDGLAYYENDPQVRVIGLHIEGMKNPRIFIDTARRVARKKPIVVLKTGRNAQAARAMQSHTGSLAGDSIIWDAALKSAGLITVYSLEEFFDTIRMFSVTPLMKNNRVAIATFSGATGILTMDALQNSGIDISPLPTAIQQKLEKMAPPWLHVSNPVDYWPIMMGHSDMATAMRDIMDTLLSNEHFGALIVTQGASTRPAGERLLQFLNYLATRYPQKPVISAIAGTYNMEYITAMQKDGRHAGFPSPERAARAIANLWRYSRLFA